MLLGEISPKISTTTVTTTENTKTTFRESYTSTIYPALHRKSGSGYSHELASYTTYYDAKNETLYKQYEELAAQEGDVIFAGRLGGYKYYDMDKAIAAAFELVRNELGAEPTEA